MVTAGRQVMSQKWSVLRCGSNLSGDKARPKWDEGRPKGDKVWAVSGEMP